jgi:hypothetical protein
MDNDSLKTLEQKAYQSFFADGLWDIFFGLLLIGNAASPVLEALQLPRQIAYAIFLLSPLVLVLGRKYITTPRLGLVNFGASRKKRRVILLLMIITILIVTFFLWVIMALGKNYIPAVLKIGPHPWLIWTIEAFFLTGALWLVAYFMQFPRLYLYAIMVGFGFPLMEFIYPYLGTPWNAILAFGLPGSFVVVFGLFMTVRFVLKYPLQDPSDLYHQRNGED